MVGATLVFSGGRSPSGQLIRSQNVTLYGDWKTQAQELRAQGYGDYYASQTFSGDSPARSQAGAINVRQMTQAQQQQTQQQTQAQPSQTASGTLRGQGTNINVGAIESIIKGSKSSATGFEAVKTRTTSALTQPKQPTQVVLTGQTNKGGYLDTSKTKTVPVSYTPEYTTTQGVMRDINWGNQQPSKGTDESTRGQTSSVLTQPKTPTQEVIVGYSNYKPVIKNVPISYGASTLTSPATTTPSRSITSGDVLFRNIQELIPPTNPSGMSGFFPEAAKVISEGFTYAGTEKGKRIVGEKGITINITPSKAYTIKPETFGELTNMASYFVPYVGESRFAIDWFGAGSKAITGQPTTFGEKAVLIGGLGYSVYKLGEPSYNLFISTKVRPALESKEPLTLLGSIGEVIEKAPTETENLFIAGYKAKASYKGKIYERNIFGDIVVPKNQPVEGKVLSAGKLRVYEGTGAGGITEPTTSPLSTASIISVSRNLPPPAVEDVFFSVSKIKTTMPTGENIFTKGLGITTKGAKYSKGINIVSGEAGTQSVEFFTGLGMAKQLKTPVELEKGGTFSLVFTKLKRYQEPQESIFGNIFREQKLVTGKAPTPIFSPEEVKAIIEPTIKNPFELKPVKVKSTMVTGGLRTTQTAYNPIFYQYQESGGLFPPAVIQNTLMQTAGQELKQEQKKIPKLDLLGIQKTGKEQKQGQGLREIGIQSTSQEQKQGQKEVQLLKQVQVQQQKEVQKLKSLSLTKLAIPTPFPRFTTPHIPKVIFLTSTTSKIKSLLGKVSTSKGYQTYVKRFGKYQPFGKITTKGKAIKLGVMETKKTLSATFKITPTRKEITELDLLTYEPPSKEFRGYRVIKGIKIPLELTFIQRAPYRLGTLSERKEIQQARKQSKSNIFKNKGRFRL